MSEINKTMKLSINADEKTGNLLRELDMSFAKAGNYVSQYIFSNKFELNFDILKNVLSDTLANDYGLKSDMALSVIKAVAGRYEAVAQQLSKNFNDENRKEEGQQNKTHILEKLKKPVFFPDSQADLTPGELYSFSDDGKVLYIKTLDERVKVHLDIPKCFQAYFDGSWNFGIAKLVFLKDEIYINIPISKSLDDVFSRKKPAHIVGINCGQHFLLYTYDEKEQTCFYSGKETLEKHEKFMQTCAELRERGTISARRKLEEICEHESMRVTNENHRLAKEIIEKYGPNTLFVIEDFRSAAPDNGNNPEPSQEENTDKRIWPFDQFEQILGYKAAEYGSYVLKVPSDFISERCPRCGRINRSSSSHDKHEYVCNNCSYKSNDVRVIAMNLHYLGTQYTLGNDNPRFVIERKQTKHVPFV